MGILTEINMGYNGFSTHSYDHAHLMAQTNFGEQNMQDDHSMHSESDTSLSNFMVRKVLILVYETLILLVAAMY